MSRAALRLAPPRKASREVELTLVINDPNPEGVRRRLARVRRLDGYTLRPRGSEGIVDYYFDTPDGRLQSRKIALRLREVRGETLISLKGRQRRASTRTEDRLEIKGRFRKRRSRRWRDGLGFVGLDPRPKRT